MLVYYFIIGTVAILIIDSQNMIHLCKLGSKQNHIAPVIYNERIEVDTTMLFLSVFYSTRV